MADSIHLTVIRKDTFLYKYPYNDIKEFNHKIIRKKIQNNFSENILD